MCVWVSFASANPALAWGPDAELEVEGSGAATVERGAAPSAGTLVVLQGPGSDQRGLVAALRIQLIDTSLVEERPWNPEGSLAERIERASAVGKDASAQAVVWSEAGPPKPDHSREAILYMVGQRDGRALLEVVRVNGDRGPELDRALALKIIELLREIQSAASAAPSGEALAPPRPAGPARLTREGPQFGGFAQVGPRFAASLAPSRLRFGVGAALGPSLQSGAWLARVLVGLDVYPAITVAHEGDAVQLSELAPLAGLALFWSQPAFALGLRTGLALSILRATGRSLLGSFGESTQRTLSWSGGIALERSLVSGLALAASLDIQLHAVRHRFDVNGETVADLGRAQLLFGVDLVFRTEWSAAR